MKILVKSDVYNICNRVKKFDTSYYIVFNTVSNMYEIYSSRLYQNVELISGRVLSYVCTLPYTELDERVIKYLYDTSIDRLDDIIAKIDSDNNELEIKQNNKLKNQSLLIAENKLRQLT